MGAGVWFVGVWNQINGYWVISSGNRGCFVPSFVPNHIINYLMLFIYLTIRSLRKTIRVSPPAPFPPLHYVLTQGVLSRVENGPGPN